MPRYDVEKEHHDPKNRNDLTNIKQWSGAGHMWNGKRGPSFKWRNKNSNPMQQSQGKVIEREREMVRVKTSLVFFSPMPSFLRVDLFSKLRWGNPFLKIKKNKHHSTSIHPVMSTSSDFKTNFSLTKKCPLEFWWFQLSCKILVEMAK